ncbi:prepilin-type N-terminal cleavage/methylation domain-containing protein [Weissella paramesenteroides]|uniref:prepilin-type N-terminal cleavage/methylation domain-containing protein n=1 Tax=Weissella paramesenteroides TaxID=1249 RepID=UPI003F74651E
MVNRSGFTLIECIVAFTILSGLFLIFSISSQGLNVIKQHHNYEIQKCQVTRLVDRLENDALNYQIIDANDCVLTIKNVKTNKTYQFGLWGKCLCLYRNDGKFLSYMLGVKRVAFKELIPYLYVITLEFDNGSIFKEEIYINGQKS